ncbi:Alpha-humulene synthase [Linum grandiflorum]
MLTTTDTIDNDKTIMEGKLRLIDTIQRLGVGYLFETEIEELTENIYSLGEDSIIIKNANVYHAALWFRLLRQQGFSVSPNVFAKLKGNDGNFKEELASDVQGLLSLYEAAHLAAHGEHILDEALIFATNNLSRRSNNIQPSLQKQVKFALSLPVWKCVPRTLARNYIDFYDDNNTIDTQLLRFAKLDFNRLQKLHQQELREITEFDMSSHESLPDAMKNIYRALIDLYDEFHMELSRVGPTFGVDYAKEELKKICKCYLIEIKWRTEGYVPTIEEHKKVANVTGGTRIIVLGAFLGMGHELATREAYEWVSNDPKIVEATSLIGRLQNDLVSFQFERKRKHAATSIDCYMKEYSISEEEAIRFIWAEISKAWKDIVECCSKPTPVPMELIDRVLNFARFCNVIYKDGDGYTNSHLIKSEIASLFVDPIPLL